MTTKLDIYRILREIGSIRKSFFWQNIDTLDKLKQSEYLRRHIQLTRELDSVSTTNLSIVIFLTSVFLAALQLIQSIYNSLNTIISLILICFYVFCLFLSFLVLIIQQRKNKK
jgi:hypothetical protein